MPPVTTMRKMPVAGSNDVSGSGTKRTASGRAIRNNTTRPVNYYARAFASLSAAAADNEAARESANSPPGFFPALQYFSDAITALPKEVIKQFTQMKEVEAKIHSGREKLGEAVDTLIDMPLPPRKSTIGQTCGGGQQSQGLISLTTNNSTAGSTNASLVNGVAGNQTLLHPYSAQNSVSGSVIATEETVTNQYETEEELARRKQYHDLRLLTRSLLPILDEKNAVLAEANRVLGLQLRRIDSVLPHVDNEISEEARLGSMTHWAYSDNRQKKTAAGTTSTTAASRRDVAAANNLAAAAHALHEKEIAQTRRDAGREVAKEKQGKGKRTAEHVDSDFDDRPRKTQAKGVKGRGAGPPATGLGITTNGEQLKKRKIEKGLAAPGMERSVSATNGKGAKSGRDTPRSTPAAEPSKKVTKARPAPPPVKKRMPNSAQNSPALASSPLHSSFNANTTVPPPGARPQSARLRQNSYTTNLRHENVADGEHGRTVSSDSRPNGNSKQRGSRDDEEHDAVVEANEPGDEANLKREDIEMQDNDERPAPSRQASGSGKAGRGSKTGTPRTDSFPADVPMSRTRSTRSTRGGTGRDSSSSEPQYQGRENHKRNVSNSHLIKQLAPFNRSPDLDRRQLDDMDEDLDSPGKHEEGREKEEDEKPEAPRTRSSRPNTSSRPTSRRDMQRALHTPSPPAPALGAGGDEEEFVEEHSAPPPAVDDPSVPDLADDEVDEEEDDDVSEHDPDDPNEPKYCYCNRGSYGEMVACDNDACPKEWFHIGCTELKASPGADETWYCRECRPLFSKRGRGGNGVKASGRGGR